jgi:hypothetical protein
VGDALSLAETILPRATPPAMLDMVLAAADGNPLFLEELIAALIDRRILEFTGDTWTVRELPVGFTLPDSIQAVLAARLDLLPPSDKMALQAASVIEIPLLDLFVDTNGANPAMKNRADMIVTMFEGRDPGPTTFSIANGVKDLRTMVETGEARGADMRATKAALSGFEDATTHGFGGGDGSRMSVYWASRKNS